MGDFLDRLELTVGVLAEAAEGDVDVLQDLILGGVLVPEDKSDVEQKRVDQCDYQKSP